MNRCLVLLVALCAPIFAHATNAIQIENAKPGNTDWVLFHEADGQIEGYASATSVNLGETIRFYVHAVSSTYTMNVYRMGWYSGAGARKVLGPIQRTSVTQPMPAADPVTGLIECNWLDPYSLTIPNDWTSGIYLVKLSADGLQRDKYIVFVVRDDARFSNHNFQSTVTTSQAYNNWGGKSLYGYNSDGEVAADKVSFNRPYADGSGTGTFLFRWEYNMVRFMEREGYDVTYSTNVDTHRNAALLLNHEDFLSIGHDEYWSWEMRANVQAARDAGIDLGFFCGNSIYWQIRFEPSTIDGAADRVMVGYKEDAQQKDPFALDNDPSNDNRVTTKWRSAPVSLPEGSLIGVQYVENPVDGDIVIDDVTSAPWVFANTTLTTGSVLPGLLGYEVDAIAASSPPSVIRLAHSPFTTTDDGTSGYSDMTVYTAASGATVFATGSIQWAWGVDDFHTSDRPSRVNADAQQITRNVLTHMAGTNFTRDCSFIFSPGTTTLSSVGGSGSLDFAPSSQCPSWTITEEIPWLAITSAATGSGNGTLTFTFDPNPGATRTGTLHFNSTDYTVTQVSCADSFTLTPASTTKSAAGGGVAVNVNGDPGCVWSAVSNASWINVESGAPSSGNGVVELEVAPTAGPARSGTVTIANRTFTVNQLSGCAFTFDPNGLAVSSAGGNGSLEMTASSQDCAWTLTLDQSWVHLTSPASGVGDATITFTVDANGGSSRDAGLYANGTRVNIHQSSGCSYIVSPTSAAMPAAGGTGAVTISASTSCYWISTSYASWIVITSGANGNGNGTTEYSVQPNTTGEARTGLIVVAGTNVTITQRENDCTFAVAPTSANYSSSASSGTATVTTQSACAWTPVIESGGDFVTITSGAAGGTGNGSFTYALSANTTNSARTAVIRVGGGSITITQGANGYSSFAATATGVTSSSVTVTWSAVTGASSYDILRSENGASFSVVGTTATTSFTNTGLPANHEYLYRVRANGPQPLAYSNIDPATTFTFTDPLTTIRAVHFTELRTIINALRADAGLAPFSYSSAVMPGTPVRAVHILEMRTALNQARVALGLPALTFTDPTLTVIKAVHIQELRNGVK